MDAAIALPPTTRAVVDRFVGAAITALGDDLVSVVLYGSGAEGQLRASSDVNVIVVLRRFGRQRVDGLRSEMRMARSAIGLRAMFLLESELAPVASAFAVKFADVVRRHVVLHGPDPFESLSISRSARIADLKQLLLNFVLRTREAYVVRSLRTEQLALSVAEAAGPLRAAASTLIELATGRVVAPKEALRRIAEEQGAEALKTVEALSIVREQATAERVDFGAELLRLIDVAEHMLGRAADLQIDGHVP